MSTHPLALAAVAMTALAGCSHTADHPSVDGAPVEVLQAADVEWEQLNPARGDASPRAGTLWGDRKGDVATGFLVSFVDGFSSPPHLHNVSYRGVVIHGLVHNDDPDAADMWMPAGSFWTQPKGEVHITSARGDHTVAYIEIESGPYLVLPVEKAFDSGERPVNVDPSNLVWIDPPRAAPSGDGPQMAHLWGRPRPGHLNGTMVRLPAGSAATLQSDGAELRMVVIQGRAELRGPGASDVTSLEPGSLVTAASGRVGRIAAGEGETCVLYVRAEGRLEVRPRR